MKENIDALEYADSCKDEVIQIIRDLVAIPAFSHHEEKRAEYVKNWFAKYDINADIDDKLNVIVDYNSFPGLERIVFMAHLDTVFPDEKGFELTEKDGYLYAPSVGDDTANAAELMIITRYVLRHQLASDYNIVFVLNSCEEGLGNLDGSRNIYNHYAENLKYFISFDGTYKGIVNKAVGSVRYKITVKAQGGHSYGNFGNSNAIAIASEIINRIYQYQVPTRGKSTYNVGTIQGGTSVNSIAQECSFLFEFRSDNDLDLHEMVHYLQNLLEEYADIEVELLGERPSNGNVQEDDMVVFISNIQDYIQHFTGERVPTHSGSTDCNIPLSKGITSACFGGYIGTGAHTYNEHLEKASLEVGLRILISYVLDYFN